MLRLCLMVQSRLFCSHLSRRKGDASRGHAHSSKFIFPNLALLNATFLNLWCFSFPCFSSFVYFSMYCIPMLHMNFYKCNLCEQQTPCKITLLCIVALLKLLLDTVRSKSYNRTMIEWRNKSYFLFEQTFLCFLNSDFITHNNNNNNNNNNAIS
jgi:hypothetical protein